MRAQKAAIRLTLHGCQRRSYLWAFWGKPFQDPWVQIVDCSLRRGVRSSTRSKTAQSWLMNGHRPLLVAHFWPGSLQLNRTYFWPPTS